MQLKFCGITSERDALAAAEAGADFVGLILAPSPRQIDPVRARRIMDRLPPETQPVLLFKDAPLAEMVAALERTRCEWVQLHGEEPVEALRGLRLHNPNLRLVKAWTVRGPVAAEALLSYLAEVQAADIQLDVVLLDAPKGGPHPGYEALGEVSRRLTERPPEVWCAGSLTADNVADALAAGRYDGVDVASGVELAPGRKDAAEMRRFAAAVPHGGW
jgi:phosphoribosylanthranilate isomerase